MVILTTRLRTVDISLIRRPCSTPRIRILISNNITTLVILTRRTCTHPNTIQFTIKELHLRP